MKCSLSYCSYIIVQHAAYETQLNCYCAGTHVHTFNGAFCTVERAHAESLGILESGINSGTMERHGKQEESSQYEVVVQHKELRGAASVFFAKTSCYVYMDAEAVDSDPTPYEVRRVRSYITIYSYTLTILYYTA